ncbi:VOC family protein, partial [Thioclava sp. BHET1]
MALPASQARERSCAALGSWMTYAIQKQIEVQGASDHLVSEAFYLADPEGNGVEIYADRPRESWGHRNGEVVMSTDPLDLHALSAVAGDPWRGAPAGSVVGHVHLQTGQLSAVEEFYTKTLGCTISTRYPGALFLGWGGYHHHLATNIWNSRGAGPRQEPASGLTEVILNADPAALAALGARDGTR